MNSEELNIWTKELTSTLCFCHTQLHPTLLQTYHQLVINSFPSTQGIKAPFDEPIQDMITGTMIRPSEMQNHFRKFLYPAIIISVQSIAEDTLNAYYKNTKNISQRIEQAVTEKSLSRDLASEAHC